MNRAERRRLGVKNKEAVINIKQSDIEQMKEDATRESMEIAFKLMLAIPVMVVHKEYSKITKLEVDGKCREERFADLCLDLWNDFNKNKITLDELEECLYKYGGIKMK